MKTKETIAIIGATEEIGASIARNLSKESYKLILMSSDAKKLRGLKESLSSADVRAIIETNDCAKEVSWEADVIIIATPYVEEKVIAEKIREVATGKIVISMSNPLNEKYSDLVTSPNTSAAEELQKRLPNSKIVKVFNTAFAADFSSPVVDGKRVDAFIAANNGYALEMVSRLVTSAGFNPVLVGDLSVSRSLERMQVMRVRLALKSNYDWFSRQKRLRN